MFHIIKQKCYLFLKQETNKNKPSLGLGSKSIIHEVDFVTADQKNTETPETNYSKLVTFE